MYVNGTLLRLVSTSATAIIVSKALEGKQFDLEQATGPAAVSLQKHICNMKPRIMAYKNSAHFHAVDALKDMGKPVREIDNDETVYGYFVKTGYVEQLSDRTILFRRSSKGPNPVEAHGLNQYGDDVMYDVSGTITAHWKPTVHWVTRLVRFGKKMITTTRERHVKGRDVSMEQKLFTKNIESMRSTIEMENAIIMTDTGSRPKFTQTVLMLDKEDGLVNETVSVSDSRTKLYDYHYAVQDDKSKLLTIRCDGELYFEALLEDK